MKLSWYGVFAAGCLLTVVPAYAESGVEYEIKTLKEDVRALQRQLYKSGGSSAAASASSTAAVTSDIQGKIGVYDESIRKVNGRMDELENMIKKLDQKLDKINRDMEIRFKILEGRQVPADLSAPVSSVTTKDYAAPVAVNASRTVVGDSIEGGDLLPIAGTVAAEEKQTTKSVSGSGPESLIPEDETGTQSAPAAVKAASSEDMYASGMQAFNGGYYDEAELAFQHILQKFPKDKLAGNAQYWLGEVYYKQGNFQKAKLAFKTGYENYKGGNKAPDSLFKLGMTMKSLQENKNACIVFMSFGEEFPKADAELAKRVKAESSRLGCK